MEVVVVVVVVVRTAPPRHVGVYIRIESVIISDSVILSIVGVVRNKPAPNMHRHAAGVTHILPLLM